MYGGHWVVDIRISPPIRRSGGFPVVPQRPPAACAPLQNDLAER